MKKIAIVFAIGFSFTSVAQSFSLYKTDANFVSTSTITNGNFVYEGTVVNAVVITKFLIKNNAAVTQSLNVTRTIVTQLPAFDLSAVANAPTTYYCFGNNCFTPPVSTPGPSDYTILLAAGQTSTAFPLADNSKDNNQPFSIDLEEGTSTGSYVVKYKLFNVNNANDTLAFYMAYNQPLGLHENKTISDLDLTIFPNPANNEATVFMNSKSNSDIKLTVLNSIGQTVISKEQKLNMGSNFLTFDCKNLDSGLYFVIVKSGQNTQTKKLIITK